LFTAPVQPEANRIISSLSTRLENEFFVVREKLVIAAVVPVAVLFFALDTDELEKSLLRPSLFFFKDDAEEDNPNDNESSSPALEDSDSCSKESIPFT